eukprot:s890_g29.t1
MSAKQMTTAIQHQVNQAICEGHVGLTEGELIWELKDYAEDRGVHQRDGRWFHAMLRVPDHRREAATFEDLLADLLPLADGKAEARTALSRDLGIDPAASPATRAALEGVVAAWQQCADAADKERAVKAEARVMGLPKPLLVKVW